MKMQQKSNSKIYSDIMETMLLTLESKNLYIAKHSTRVGDMAYKLGGVLGMNEDELQAVYLGGNLHDIGKIGIPDKILNKKDGLDENELGIMKKHSQIGYDILSKSRYLNYISYLVLHTHERWDGKGYPNGLGGEEIPIEARIISICDSIDAMKSNRPYKRPMSDLECRQELIKNKGIMYDEKIVECIIENWCDIVTKDI